MVHRSQTYYVYSTTELPVNPNRERQQQNIRKNCNDFRVLEDGIVNKEHWFLKATKMDLVGQVKISKDRYAAMLMGYGFMNEPNVNKLKLEPYTEETVEFGGKTYKVSEIV